MIDEELKQAESETLRRLQASEVHWHLIKAFLVALCCVATIGVVIYYSNQTKIEIQKNRSLVSCSLQAFSPDNDGNTEALIKKCIKTNR